MSKIRIYIEPAGIKNQIQIKEKAVIHKAKDVLRLNKTKRVYVFDGQGAEYLYRIREMDKRSILIDQESVERKETPPSKKIIVGFPLIKEDKVDFILQKATELGAYAFWPFTCERSMQGEFSCLKLERWRRIVIEATRQSNRVWLPQIMRTSSIKTLIAREFDIKVAASVDGQNLKGVIKKQWKELLFIVGPEGDFSPSEYQQLREGDFGFVKFAPHILRTETAAIFGVGLINYSMDVHR
ncbi:MAG: 16S rRNA (uracil(1498)-N(3))-methyltransferase [Candidatus Omnitrophota bacterium]|nr:MAG: 16S rRNA (uracil(1498)-N(3))-methyltransferase [Candidatus Omnitrophota bacterium]